MTKAEEKRAAIVAKQEAREAAERDAKQANGTGAVGGRAGSAKASNQLGGVPCLRRTSPWVDLHRAPANRKFPNGD